MIMVGVERCLNLYTFSKSRVISLLDEEVCEYISFHMDYGL
jgi:hypothetical protein